MKEYFKKHEITIIFFLIFIVLSFTLIPNERKHYLTENVNDFKENIYWRIMTIASIFVILIVIIYKKNYKNNFKQIMAEFIKLAIVCLVFSFLLQNVIMSLLLFINRLKSNEIIIKEYIVVDKIENNHFVAKELNSDEIITERDYFKQNGKIEIEKIKIKDTLKIKTQKGIFEIEYY
jgi:low affinity Fe/Cu permease